MTKTTNCLNFLTLSLVTFIFLQLWNFSLSKSECCFFSSLLLYTLAFKINFIVVGIYYEDNVEMNTYSLFQLLYMLHPISSFDFKVKCPMPNLTLPTNLLTDSLVFVLRVFFLHNCKVVHD